MRPVRTDRLRKLAKLLQAVGKRTKQNRCLAATQRLHCADGMSAGLGVRHWAVVPPWQRRNLFLHRLDRQQRAHTQRRRTHRALRRKHARRVAHRA